MKKIKRLYGSLNTSIDALSEIIEKNKIDILQTAESSSTYFMKKD